MSLVSIGIVSLYEVIHFNVNGTAYQVTGVSLEAMRLVLIQVLLQKKGSTQSYHKLILHRYVQV